jgi:tight adherence protein B
MRLSVGEYVLITAVCAGGAYLAGQSYIPLLGVPLAVIGAIVPYLVVKHKQRERLKKFEAQLPEAVDMLVNAMKAGYSFQAAVKFIGDEMPGPLGPEFTRVYDEQRLGMEIRNALLNLQDRVPLLDVKMFVTAVLLQRETGGNLAEIMGNLSTLMRERVALRGHVDTLTAEPKLSAVVLSVLPVALFFLISSANRDYVKTLWITPTGKLLLAYGIVSTLIGYIILRKMGNIDI